MKVEDEAMTDAPQIDPRQAICENMDITLYGRFTESEVCDKLGVSLPTLRRMRASGKIGYLKVGRKVEFFGYQLCDYLLAAVTIPETAACRSTMPPNDSNLEMLGSHKNPDRPHGSELGTIQNPAKHDVAASALRILKRQKRS